MIYHQVRFAMKPEAPKDQVEAAVELLRRLGRELEVVESFCVGRDFGGEFTVGALYVLKDIKAYETYMNAPLHLQIDRAGLPLVSNMISQDLTDDEDPAIGEKIAEIHRLGTQSTRTSRLWSGASVPTRAAASPRATRHRSSARHCPTRRIPLASRHAQ